MSIRISQVEREFSPAEVAQVTGVNVTLQRDWRRRKILPERKTEGWSRCSLSDLIEIHVLNFFARAGFFVKDMREYSSMAILPIIVSLKDMPGTVVFEGDPISDRLKESILFSIESDAGAAARARYLVIAHGDDIPLNERIGRFSTLGAVETWLEGRALESFTALDFGAMAGMIAASVNGPLIRFECEALDE